MKKIIDIFFASILWIACAAVGGVVLLAYFLATLLKGFRHE